MKDRDVEHGYDLIIEGVRVLFLSQGQIHATTQQIADACGVSRTLLHYYFKSMSSLSKAISEDIAESLAVAIKESMSRKRCLYERIRILIDALSDDALKYPYKLVFLTTHVNKYHTISFWEALFCHPAIQSFTSEMDNENIKGKLAVDARELLLSTYSLFSCTHIIADQYRRYSSIGKAQEIRLQEDKKRLLLDYFFQGT